MTSTWTFFFFFFHKNVFFPYVGKLFHGPWSKNNVVSLSVKKHGQISI